MATRQELTDFLAGIERRAFRQAFYAVRNEDTALDLVQDAMTRLIERYAERPAAELAPLFQRILQNAIYDHFRREKVRRLWTTLLSSFIPDHGEDDDSSDPLEYLASDTGTGPAEDTADKAERHQVLAIIEDAISRLPARQREAFLLRYWEEFDVAQTANAMGCSEGSVKTHCSRAVRALASALRERGISV